MISEISLKREPCFGICPVYEVILRSDGTATYTGRANVERIGRYRGLINQSEFLKIAEKVERQEFFKLRSKYAVPVSDLGAVIIKVVRRGRAKKVKNYGGAAPINLRVIEEAVDAAVERVKWEEEDKQSRR